MSLSQEQRLKKVNSILKAIRNVSQLITKENNKSKLIEGVCQIFTEESGYYNAWIALTDGKGKPEKYCESKVGKSFNTLIKLAKEGNYLNCWKEAMSSTEIIIRKDPKKECPDCPLSNNYGGRREATVRLEYNGKIYGILSASLPPEYLEGKEEMGLFSEVAGGISFALYSIEQKEKKRKFSRELEIINETIIKISHQKDTEEICSYI